MAEDWLADVRRYAADADEKVVGAIVRYCGIALRNRDSSLVSFTDKKETDRVRDNFLKKKLGLAHRDEELDTAIAAVGERMQADRTRNRVTVYYLLTDHYGLLTVFGGAADAQGEAVAPSPAPPLGIADLPPEPAPRAAGSEPVAPLTAASAVGVGGVAPTPVHAAPAPRSQGSGLGSDGRGSYESLDWALVAVPFVILALFAVRSIG